MTHPISGQKIIVTGGSGFIGKRVISKLVEAGANVTAILRTKHAALDIQSMGASTRIHELNDETAMVEALRDADVLVHLAYDVRASGTENVATFSHVVRSAETAGTKRIVHLSSIVVYDEWPTGDLDETSPRTLENAVGYRRAKIEMEEQLMARGIDHVILQPTLVFGPGSALWTDRICRAFLAGEVFLPETDGVCHGVFVDDVASAVLAGTSVSDQGLNQSYIISGDGSGRWHAFYEAHQKLLGTGSVSVVSDQSLYGRIKPVGAPPAHTSQSTAAKVSAMMRKTIGHARFEAVLDQLRRMRPPQGPTYPDRLLLDLLTGTGQLNIEKSAQLLGYSPQYALASGMAETAEYIRGKFA